MDTIESSAPAHPSSDDHKPTMPDDFLEAHYSCLERLEDDFRHANLGIEERCELEDRVLRLRQRLSRWSGAWQRNLPSPALRFAAVSETMPL